MRSTKEFTKFFPIGPQGPLSLCNPENLLAVQFGFYVLIYTDKIKVTLHNTWCSNRRLWRNTPRHLCTYFLFLPAAYELPSFSEVNPLNLGVVRE